MGTIVEFQLLGLDSLMYRSKAESPINRSAKAVSSRNLTTSQHNQFLFAYLFVYLFICLFIYLFIYLLSIYLFVMYFFLSFLNFLYIYRKQALPTYLHSDSNRCCWLT